MHCRPRAPCCTHYWYYSISFPADCSAECQRRHWSEGGHRQACKSAAIVVESAKLGLPPSIMFVGHTDG